MSARRFAVALVLAATALAAPAAAAPLAPRVMVLPTEGEVPSSLAGLDAQVDEAVSRAASRTTPNVAHAAASLSDTALAIGCDPAARTCLDAVAATLNVDQLLIVRLTGDDRAALVEVVAFNRGSVPVTRRFMIRPDARDADVESLEEAVPAMLEPPEGVPPDGDGGDGGSGDGGTGDGGSGDGGPGDGGPGDGGPGDGGLGPTGPGPTGPTGPTGPVEGRPDPRLPLGVAIGGGVAVVAGGAMWFLAAGVQSDIDSAPTDTLQQLRELEDLEAKGRRYALIGNGLVIGGAAVAVAGGTWWFLQRRRARRDTVVTPARVGTGSGLVIMGAW